MYEGRAREFCNGFFLLGLTVEQVRPYVLGLVGWAFGPDLRVCLCTERISWLRGFLFLWEKVFVHLYLSHGKVKSSA